MAHTVSVLIPDDVYQHVETEANNKKQTVEDTLSSYLVEAVRQTIDAEPGLSPLSHEQRLMLEEMGALERMYDELVNVHLGKWVAIYRGHLVDSDWDAAALMARRLHNYPGQIVLIDKIETDRQPGTFQLPFVRVVSMPNGDETVIGRDVLNHLIVTLNGIEGFTEIS